jgi:trehalose 6-phosphate phosphatase
MISSRQRLIAEIGARLSTTLIALDFDGTLAPIVADPRTSSPVDGTVEVLRSLAQRGAQVALITGRDAATAIRLSGLESVPNLIVDGLYGAQRWQDGELFSPAEPESITRARVELTARVGPSALARGVWIEDKVLSLVIHARRTADPAQELAALKGTVRDLAAQVGLEVHPGRDVLELRLPDFDKGRAIRTLAEASAATAVLFAGDDLGDLPAFAALVDLRARGLVTCSVAVNCGDVAEIADVGDLTVASPAELVQLLGEIGADQINAN